jgi:hypothetical protein
MYKYSAGAGNGTGAGRGLPARVRQWRPPTPGRRRTSVCTPLVARATFADRSSNSEGPRRFGRGGFSAVGVTRGGGNSAGGWRGRADWQGSRERRELVRSAGQVRSGATVWHGWGFKLKGGRGAGLGLENGRGMMNGDLITSSTGETPRPPPHRAGLHRLL